MRYLFFAILFSSFIAPPLTLAAQKARPAKKRAPFTKKTTPPALYIPHANNSPVSVSPLGATDAYTYLSTKENELRTLNHNTGWAYIVSGTVVLGVSIPGYYLSKDTLPA